MQRSALWLPVRQPLPDCPINCFTNLRDMFIDLQIRKTQYLDAFRRQHPAASFIISHLHRIIMLRTIELNRQPDRRTLKIQDITAQNFLPLDWIRIPFQIIIPQMTFLRCHFPPQSLRPLLHFRPIIAHKTTSRKDSLHRTKTKTSSALRAPSPCVGKADKAGPGTTVTKQFPTRPQGDAISRKPSPLTAKAVKPTSLPRSRGRCPSLRGG